MSELMIACDERTGDRLVATHNGFEVYLRQVNQGARTGVLLRDPEKIVALRDWLTKFLNDKESRA